MHMLDTNICIYVLKHRDQKLKRKFNAIRNLCISSITYGELCYGIENGAVTLKQERYNLGSGTSLDLRIARDQLTRAELDILNAKFNAKKAELEIEKLLGTINVGDF